MTSKLITIPKPVVIVVLASFYTLAFIITPYWRRAGSTPEMILILSLTLLIGAVWVILAGNDLPIRIAPTRWGFLLVLLLVSLLLNLKPLTSVIPWRGDEDYHIQNTLALASQISTKWLLAFWVVFFLLLYSAWRRTRWMIPADLCILLGIIFFIWLANPFAGIKDTVLFRYPYLNYWFFALLPKLALIWQGSPYYEVLFRIVPFIASVALVWICQMYFLQPEKPIDLLWGGAVATLPLLFYYSSILYLELPAIFLMTLVCMNIQSLLQEDFQKIRQNPSWYALILIGFIKETTTLFLLCFVLWRFIAVLRKSRGLSLQMEYFQASNHSRGQDCAGDFIPRGSLSLS